MPTTSATSTSGRLLALLSLLQAPRDWPGWLLAERMEVSERTLRRDVERLRELGYEIRAVKGRDGGYRLDAGSVVPPMLFDDDQVVAIAIALRAAPSTGADIEESAARALGTLRQVLPAKLRSRIDAVEMTPVAGSQARVSTDVLVTIGDAIKRGEILRFDYDNSTDAPRSVEPHSLIARNGRWYVVGWSAPKHDWRIYRADRMALRTPNGPRFARRELDATTFLEARFKGSDSANEWPCVGEAVLHGSAAYVSTYAGDATVEALGLESCRVRMGAWSWASLAASLCRFDVDIEVVGPQKLRNAFAALAERAQRV